MEMKQDEIKLLEITTKDLLKVISEYSEAHHVKQKAFQFLVKNEEVQVQIIVTRHKDNFLDDFETEIMNGY